MDECLPVCLERVFDLFVLLFCIQLLTVTKGYDVMNSFEGIGGAYLSTDVFFIK